MVPTLTDPTFGNICFSFESSDPDENVGSTDAITFRRKCPPTLMLVTLPHKNPIVFNGSFSEIRSLRDILAGKTLKWFYWEDAWD